MPLPALNEIARRFQAIVPFLNRDRPPAGHDPGDAAALRRGAATRPPVLPGSLLGKAIEAVSKERETRRRYDGTANIRMLIEHQEQFASKFGTGLNVYWSRFDEALRDNWTNALAMRRSSFIEEILQARKLPIASLEWHVEVDDPKDADQAAVAGRITKAIDAIPQFNALRYYLGEDKWQGKYASQVTWGPVQIDGREMVTVLAHEPVDGDSIVYRYDRTPGILIRTGWAPDNGIDRAWVDRIVKREDAPEAERGQDWVMQADRARALFLYDQFWRDHFIISNFNPRSADYLFEGDKAASIFGVGFRGMLYWDFQLREELRSWLVEALQRIGVNGMLYGFFESGNAAMMDEVITSLKLIIRDNVTAFPYAKGSVPEEIRHIEPSQVGYDVLAHWIDQQEESMRRSVIGQSLSSQAESTGMGSEVAELHRTTLEHILRSDAAAQQEVLTKDLLGPMVRFNSWEYKGRTYKGTLPFRVRFVYAIDKANAKERSDIYNSAFNMGLELSKEAMYADLGITAPKSPEDTLRKPDPAPAGPGAPGMGGGGAAPGNPAAMGRAPGDGANPDESGPDAARPKRFTVHRDHFGTLKIRKGKAAAPGAAEAANGNGAAH